MLMSAFTVAIPLYVGFYALSNAITFFEEGKKEADKVRYTVKEFVTGESL
jgi:hypothetical protein